MTKRDHLQRLPAEFYRSHAVVHWSLTMLDREQGWLTPIFYYRFRELLTHAAFATVLRVPCFASCRTIFIWFGWACLIRRISYWR